MKYVWMVLAFIGSIATAIFSGKAIGKAEEREKQATQSAKQSKRSSEIDDAIRDAGAQSARKRLRDIAK